MNNKKGISRIAVIVAILVVLALGGYYFIFGDKKLNTETTVPAGSAKQLNYAFIKNINNETHIIFNGKDLGIYGGDEPFLIARDGHVAFSGPTKGPRLPGAKRFIYDGKDLGEMDVDITRTPIEYLYEMPLISSGHYAFVAVAGSILDYYGEKSGQPFRSYLVYDGKDLGDGYNPIVAGDHLLYEKNINGVTHYIYDNKDIGEKERVEIATIAHMLPWYHGETFKEVNGERHLIYEGKDWGEFKNGSYVVNESHVAIVREAGVDTSDGGVHPYFHVYYDGMDLGQTTNSMQTRPILEDDHILYYGIIEKEEHFVYDGKDKGKATVPPSLSGDHFAYISTLGHVIIDDKDVGEGRFVVID